MQSPNLYEKFNPFRNVLTHGIKTVDLQDLDTADLQKIYALNHAFGTRRNLIPAAYRAQPAPTDRANERIAKNTNQRIERILKARGTEPLYVRPDPDTIMPPPPYRGFLDNAFFVGDRVHAKFPDINQVPRVTVEHDGTIAKIEAGRRGEIYHVVLDNGETRLLDKSCLSRLGGNNAQS